MREEGWLMRLALSCCDFWFITYQELCITSIGLKKSNSTRGLNKSLGFQKLKVQGCTMTRSVVTRSEVWSWPNLTKDKPKGIFPKAVKSARRSDLVPWTRASVHLEPSGGRAGSGWGRKCVSWGSAHASPMHWINAWFPNLENHQRGEPSPPVSPAPTPGSAQCTY